MRNNKHLFKAYTLIEVSVVIAIIGIVSAILLVNPGSSRSVRDLANTGQEIVSVLREAQNDALAGFQGSSSYKPCGFKFWWNSTTYKVIYQYKQGDACTGESDLRVYQLSNGVSFSSAGSFVFGLPHANITANQTIVLGKGSFNQVVCVSLGGRIATYVGSTCP